MQHTLGDQKMQFFHFIKHESFFKCVLKIKHRWNEFKQKMLLINSKKVLIHNLLKKNGLHNWSGEFRTVLSLINLILQERQETFPEEQFTTNWVSFFVGEWIISIFIMLKIDSATCALNNLMEIAIDEA